jgi:hypothetical protein
MATTRLATLSRHVYPPRELACRPCATAAPDVDGPPLSVFVLIGQSNMAGRGELLPPGGSVPSAAGDIFCFGYDDDTWQPATEPFHLDPPIVASLSSPEPKGHGLGLAFARKLLDEGLVDGSVGLVPCAFGGSPLSRWVRQPREGALDRRESDSADVPADIYEGKAQELPSNPGEPGDLYERAWRRTKLALAAHPNAVLRGFLWHQGESDATTLELASTVASRLGELIGNLRDDLTAECVPFPYARRREFEVPFVIGELGAQTYGSTVQFPNGFVLYLCWQTIVLHN